MPGIFITGTDTGIGKTYVTVTCLDALQQGGVSAVGMKPVASGAQVIDGNLRNEDALLMQAVMKQDVPYELINPYCFEPPVSPHLAAQQAGVDIDLNLIQHHYQQLEKQSELVIVEGVGGWLAPLTQQLSVADMARKLNLPIILVVGIRLGCLNHARLSHIAIKNSGMQFAGWIANHLQSDMQYATEQIEYLTGQFGYSPLFVLQQKKNQRNLSATSKDKISSAVNKAAAKEFSKGE